MCFVLLCVCVCGVCVVCVWCVWCVWCVRVCGVWCSASCTEKVRVSQTESVATDTRQTRRGRCLGSRSPPTRLPEWAALAVSCSRKASSSTCREVMCPQEHLLEILHALLGCGLLPRLPRPSARRRRQTAVMVCEASRRRPFSPWRPVAWWCRRAGASCDSARDLVVCTAQPPRGSVARSTTCSTSSMAR